MKIGPNELPLMEPHSYRLNFQNVPKIFCSESTEDGWKNFLITKNFAIGTNIQLQRVYESDNIIIDMKFKPSISISFGRVNLQAIIASILFCEDEIRINHYQHIDKMGKVTYSLASHPKKDTIHDINLKLYSKDKVMIFSLHWQNITANIAMSESGVTIQ